MLPFSQTIFKNLIPIVFFLTFGLPVMKAGYAKSLLVGTVVATQLHIRSGPSMTHPSRKVIGKGEKVLILKRDSGWLEVLHDGQVGYVRDREQYVRVSMENAGEPDRKYQFRTKLKLVKIYYKICELFEK